MDVKNLVISVKYQIRKCYFIFLFIGFTVCNHSHVVPEEKRGGWGTWYVWERAAMHTEFWWGQLRERDHLEHIGVMGGVCMGESSGAY
jgi:hypothetical protein